MENYSKIFDIIHLFRYLCLMIAFVFIIVIPLFFIILTIRSLRNDINRNAYKLAQKKANQIFPVWAYFGPFRDGNHSATIMLLTWIAVFGIKNAKNKVEYFVSHAKAFDKDPEEWEDTRKTVLNELNDNHSDYILQIRQLYNLVTSRDNSNPEIVDILDKFFELL